MTRQKKTFKGTAHHGREPVWAPLLAVVGPLTTHFMWMGEISLENGRQVHAYKHRETRRYLHLDTQGQAYQYAQTDRYRLVDRSAALTEAFSGWHRLAFAPTPEEDALIEELYRASARGGWDTDEVPAETNPTVTLTVTLDRDELNRALRRLPAAVASDTPSAAVAHAISMYALDRELFHDEYPRPLTGDDYRRLLLDEEHQTGRLGPNCPGRADTPAEESQLQVKTFEQDSG